VADGIIEEVKLGLEKDFSFGLDGKFSKRDVGSRVGYPKCLPYLRNRVLPYTRYRTSPSYPLPATRYCYRVIQV
jgi:hypothetical protein